VRRVSMSRGDLPVASSRSADDFTCFFFAGTFCFPAAFLLALELFFFISFFLHRGIKTCPFAAMELSNPSRLACRGNVFPSCSATSEIIQAYRKVAKSGFSPAGAESPCWNYNSVTCRDVMVRHRICPNPHWQCRDQD